MVIANSDFEFFKSELPKFLNEHKGQYVLNKDKAVIGFFPSIEEALKVGYEKFNNDDFLIQEITLAKSLILIMDYLLQFFH